MTIPCTETKKPRYKPIGPSDLAILTKQSPRPLNSRDAPLPTSAAKRVRAKSSGYTKQSDVAPAAPPDAKLPAKNFQKSFFLSYL